MTVPCPKGSGGWPRLRIGRGSTGDNIQWLVSRSPASEKGVNSHATFSPDGGFFLLGTLFIEQCWQFRIRREAYVTQFCWFNFAVCRQVFAGWNDVLAAVFSRLLLEECAYTFRRFVPLVFHAVVHPRCVFVEEPAKLFPPLSFDQPDLAVLGVLLARSGV